MFAAYVGGALFAVLIILVGILAALEWVRMVAPGLGLVGDAAACAAPVLAGIAAMALGPAFGAAGLAVAAAVVAVVADRFGGRRAAVAAFVYPYVGGAIVALIWLRGLPDIGMGMTYWLLFAVWASDVGGYTVGRIVGGPKLAPSVSPNKTWAGVAGGLVWAACFTAAVAHLFAASRPLFGLGAAIGVSLVAQLGDLFESGMKRHYGVKNSGQLIPGHGGVLDRIDGMLAAAPVLAVFQAMVGESIGWW